MGKQLFQCVGCGQGVLKYLSQLTNTSLVFCTLKCRNVNYKKVRPEWHPPNFKEYEHTCKSCHSKFITNGSAFKATKRSVCSPKCRAALYGRKGAVLSASTKSKLSVAASNQNINRDSRYMYKSADGAKEIQMRSGWEVKYAAWLDSQGVAWIYEPSFTLSDGRVYLADFQLESGDIIEIKGYFRPDAQIKWDMFCTEYPNIKKRLLRKQELKELRII